MNRTRSTIAAFMLILAAAAPAARAQEAAAGRVRIENVEVRLSPVGPVVLLKAGSRAIPVFVDAVVAESIQAALTGKRTPRPLTHELMRSVLDAFDGKVTQAVVTLKGQTFHAALTVMVRKESRVFDSRSSDAIALAVHFNAPILVAQDLLDAQGVDLDRPESKPAPKRETRT
ncbi:MAG: bifunctional nuclease family protein [Burkholderiales bacterium]|nr:bifunctional nuclease family protein [Burkholderiales bacterium]